MTKLKITSNPYQQSTAFRTWDSAAGAWRDISENNPNSRLLRADLQTGFFPFKAKEIVDILLEEYRVESEPVDLVFQGTGDEFRELQAICSQDGNEEFIRLTGSPKFLENARDILPDVIEVFSALKPLILESTSAQDEKTQEEINRKLTRFADAASDQIPICIIGNYSCGKSTFINALVGYELLPSSDEPTTARVYRISRLWHEDRAMVRFGYGNYDVRIRLTPDSCRFLTNPLENPLSAELSELLKEIPDASIPEKLHAVLMRINNFANLQEDDQISDVIQIEAPFDDDGLWSKVWNNFVIFDTPGSNSASNAKHYQVLRRQMENLSNGLAVFVSEYDSLDSTDNEKLFQEINTMDGIDRRFTMIVVNKADMAGLKKGGFDEKDRRRVLNLSIPRNLYSGGVYFTSSVLGLGSKNDEDFMDDHNAEIFEDQRNKYANPKSRFYKQLYKYNIMPEQLRREFDLLCAQHPNVIYANSGLYSIEMAIRNFAEIYASYNKCQQSKRFLDEVMQLAFDEIQATEQRREDLRKQMQERLDKDKQALIGRLNDRAEELEQSFDEGCEPALRGYCEAASVGITLEELQSREALLKQKNQEARDVEGRLRQRNEAVRNLGADAKENLAQAFRNLDASAFRKAAGDFGEGIQDVLKSWNELSSTKRDAETAASDELIQIVQDSCEAYADRAQELLEKQSRIYWSGCAEQLQAELARLVTDSSELTAGQRETLSGIILEYHALSFENVPAVVFDKGEFLFHLFRSSSLLNLELLTRRFNEELKAQVQQIFDDCASGHRKAFDEWEDALMNVIIDDIESFNPQLAELSEKIREEERRITMLRTRREKMENYRLQIEAMMAWKQS